MVLVDLRCYKMKHYNKIKLTFLILNLLFMFIVSLTNILKPNLNSIKNIMIIMMTLSIVIMIVLLSKFKNKKNKPDLSVIGIDIIFAIVMIICDCFLVRDSLNYNFSLILVTLIFWIVSFVILMKNENK